MNANMSMHNNQFKETILHNLGKVLKDVICDETGDDFGPESSDHLLMPAGPTVVHLPCIQTDIYHMAAARVN